MVQYLQRVAQGIGCRVCGGRLAVQVDQVAAHGGRREIAIADQVVPVVIAQLRCVLLERANQIQAMPMGHACPGQAAADVVRLAERRIGNLDAAHGPGETVQARDLVGRL